MDSRVQSLLLPKHDRSRNVKELSLEYCSGVIVLF